VDQCAWGTCVEGLGAMTSSVDTKGEDGNASAGEETNGDPLTLSRPVCMAEERPAGVGRRANPNLELVRSPSTGVPYDCAGEGRAAGSLSAKGSNEPR
jgi:hypothetical protein